MPRKENTRTRRRLLQQTALAAGAAAFTTQKAFAQTSETPGWQHFFPSAFRNERIKTSGAEINAVIVGSGPPVLMFHGAPQSLITCRRMALDHPDRILKLAVMDIVPAHYLYSHVTIDFVQAYFHWFNYLRPAPGPENELKAANDAQMAKATNEVQIEYLRNNTDPAMMHAM